MLLLAECYDGLADPDVGENRQRAIAGALRAIRLAREEANENQELEHLRGLAAQIQADRDERAAMESGGEYAHEAAELPPIGSGDRH
jgi:F0F1-type ATP synthase membrane subunit b/b'